MSLLSRRKYGEQFEKCGSACLSTFPHPSMRAVVSDVNLMHGGPIVEVPKVIHCMMMISTITAWL